MSDAFALVTILFKPLILSLTCLSDGNLLVNELFLGTILMNVVSYSYLQHIMVIEQDRIMGMNLETLTLK